MPNLLSFQDHCQHQAPSQYALAVSIDFLIKSVNKQDMMVTYDKFFFFSFVLGYHLISARKKKLLTEEIYDEKVIKRKKLQGDSCQKFFFFVL